MCSVHIAASEQNERNSPSLCLDHGALLVSLVCSAPISTDHEGAAVVVPWMGLCLLSVHL